MYQLCIYETLILVRDHIKPGPKDMAAVRKQISAIDDFGWLERIFDSTTEEWLEL